MQANLFGLANVPSNAGVLVPQNHFTDMRFGCPTIVITAAITANPAADMVLLLGTTTPAFLPATNRLAQFVSQSADALFHDQFSQYLALVPVIDFLIFTLLAACRASYICNIATTTTAGNIWHSIP